MTAITHLYAASSTSEPMRDRLATAARHRLRSLGALVGLHVSASLRRRPIHDASQFGVALRTSATPLPLESP
jgi:hypothetical protein